jgi:hypothetical protein
MGQSGCPEDKEQAGSFLSARTRHGVREIVVSSFHSAAAWESRSRIKAKRKNAVQALQT